MNDNKVYEKWLERFSAGEAKLEQATGHANVQYAGGTLPRQLLTNAYFLLK